MSSFNKTVKDFTKAIKDSYGPKTSGYDTKAEVVRVSGNTAWVHIPGGIDETPVELTVDAKKGDTVQVRVSDGSAWMTGNLTAPPTDDTAVKKFESKVNNQFVRIVKKADQASSDASFALKSANGKNTVYYSDTRPTGGTYVKGDTWFDTDNDYKMSEWNGTTWMPFQLGEDAIADLSITNAKIADATIEAAKISTVDVGSLTGGYINAGHIDTESLTIGAGTLGDKIDEMDQKDADLESDLEDLGEDIDGLGDVISDLNEDLGILENQVEAVYGECHSASFGNNIKTFEIECDGFVPFVGACIDVFFGIPNGRDNYTKKFKIIDSEGNILLDSLDLYFENQPLSDTNPIFWTYNTNIRMMYNGTHWNILNHPSVYHHGSGTAGSAATKVVTLWNMLIVKGTVLQLSLRYANTATGPLYIEITGAGTWAVTANGGTVNADDILNTGQIFESLPLVMTENNFLDNATFEYQSNLASKTARRYITYIDAERGIHVHNYGDFSNYAQLNSYGMTVYKSNKPTAFFGDYIYLGSDPSDEGDINTVITSSSMAIQSGDDPIFSVQSTGETELRNVYMLKTGKTSTIFSSAKAKTYTKTKTWDVRLKPNTYTVTLGGYTGSQSFTVGTGSYPSSPIVNMTGSHGGSVNYLNIRNGRPVYVAGTTDISEVVYTVELTGKRDSGTSTAATKRINWAAAAIYYTKEIYTADIVWNGETYSDVGKNIYINGGVDYSDSDGPDLTTDYSITSSTVNTCKSFGWIDLYDGVYVVMVRARYEPTNNGACHTWIQFSTKQNDSTCSHSCYNVKTSGYLWNQHAVMFLAYPKAVGGTSEEETGMTRYYITGKADVVGKWVRSTSTAAFQIRAVKIR